MNPKLRACCAIRDFSAPQTIDSDNCFFRHVKPRLESNWCRDEREWWFEHHSRLGDFRRRVWVSRVWPTEDSDWPKELCDERGHPPIGFWFHSREKTASAVRPFGWSGRTDEQTAFTVELLNLVGAVSQRLREYKGQLDASRKSQEEAQRLAANAGQVLYLHAREAQREAWNNAYAALGESGFVVFPAAPQPIALDPARLQDISDERVNQLVACDALLLLGTDDGFALDSDMLNVGYQSRHLARARSGKLLPCAVLAPGDESISTMQRRDLARKLGIGWIDGISSDLSSAVHDWLLNAAQRLTI